MANQGVNLTFVDDDGRQFRNKYFLIKDKPADNKKSQLAQKKQRLKKRMMLALVYTVALALLTVVYFSMQSSQSAVGTLQKTDVRVSGMGELEAVEKAFQAMNLSGSWRYKGSELADDGVHVFIKIPPQLESEVNLQVQYIKHSLCPKANNELWHYTNPEQVILHLFTRTLAQNVAATCEK